MDVKSAVEELNSELPEGISFELYNISAGKAYGSFNIDGERFRIRIIKERL